MMEDVGDLIKIQIIHKTWPGSTTERKLGQTKILYPGLDKLECIAEEGMFGGCIYNDIWPGILWDDMKLIDVVEGSILEWNEEEYSLWE